MFEKSRSLALAVAVLGVVVACCYAELRDPGKYTGVVFFDRWGGCTLYSGVFLEYVSETVKDELKPHAGKCVVLDVTKIDQPINPGDGRIQKFTAVKDVAPTSIEGIRLRAVPASRDGQAPEIVIHVVNMSEKTFKLEFNSLGPTLFTKKTKDDRGHGPSDGPSYAVFTRDSLWPQSGNVQPKGQIETWEWKVVPPRTLPQSHALLSNTSIEVQIAFKLPAGEYEFLAGYGRRSDEGTVASNAIAFDVKADGTVKWLK